MRLFDAACIHQLNIDDAGIIYFEPFALMNLIYFIYKKSNFSELPEPTRKFYFC